MTEELKECPYAEILTKDGTKVLIDERDVPLVSQYRWRFGKSERYVRTWDNERKRMVPIHRLILGFPEGGSIDHINGDPTDNRRSNLRICSQSQNMKNRRLNTNSTTGFKGVTQIGDGKFRAKIGNDGDRIDLGVYGAERDAAIAYNAGAKVLHGEFAYPNDIPPNTRTPPKVKALEFFKWKRAGGGYHEGQLSANTPAGNYAIMHHESKGLYYLVCPDSTEYYDTLDKAKAVAQADLARRVHACLDGYDD